MTPEFTTTSDAAGRPTLSIIDPVENTRFALVTDQHPTPTPASTADHEWLFPVDSATRIEARQLRVPKRAGVYVRRADAVAPVAEFQPGGQTVSCSRDEYLLEINTAPVKLYLRVEASFEISLNATAAETIIEFDDTTVVHVGVRSFHSRPAGTITVADRPASVMQAVSLFGSALKTTSPERSYPTLRGHPPLVEVGEEFDAPDGLGRPDTGVRIEVPADYEYVYPVASLAYYLGAEVVPSDRPRLVTDAGFEYGLDRDGMAFEETVARVLRQSFLMDCATRTEGYYQVDLHEREQVEDAVDLDFADLYDRPLAERLETYLSIPWSTVAEVVPEWPLTVDIDTASEFASALPFAAADLAVVRTVPTDPPAPEVPPPEADEFFRRSEAYRAPATDSDTELRDELLTLDPTDTGVSHAYAGGGVAVGANNLSVDACRRGLDQSPKEDVGIDVAVVCNDDEMLSEGTVADAYGGFADLFVEFSTRTFRDCSRAELRDLLQRDLDFLHYIGHVDDHGFQCRDGRLDVRALDIEVGVDAFILNACRSYAQGEALVERGSLGGVVTMTDIGNSIAVDVGKALAKLLNAGFPLRAAMQIARTVTQEGFRWFALGDGGLALCQPASGVPLHLVVESVSDDEFEVGIWSYPTASHGLGTDFNVHLPEVDQRTLASGEMASVTVEAETLDGFLNSERMPVEARNELFWSHEVSTDAF